MIGRRTFLTGALVTSLPVVAVAKSCDIPPDTAEARARHHLTEFIKAMNEATQDASGWIIDGGCRNGTPWASIKTVHHKADSIPNGPGFMIEVHQRFEGVSI